MLPIGGRRERDSDAPRDALLQLRLQARGRVARARGARGRRLRHRRALLGRVKAATIVSLEEGRKEGERRGGERRRRRGAIKTQAYFSRRRRQSCARAARQLHRAESASFFSSANSIKTPRRRPGESASRVARRSRLSTLRKLQVGKNEICIFWRDKRGVVKGSAGFEARRRHVLSVLSPAQGRRDAQTRRAAHASHRLAFYDS